MAQPVKYLLCKPEDQGQVSSTYISLLIVQHWEAERGGPLGFAVQSAKLNPWAPGSMRDCFKK